MDQTTTADTSASTPDTTPTDQAPAETGNADTARWARNAADLAVVEAAGRGEAATHDALAAVHRLLSGLVVAS